MVFDKKQKKRFILDYNKTKGKIAEEYVKDKYESSGWEIERTGRGSDLKGKRGKNEIYIEVKSGDADLSPLQEKTRRSKRSKYIVERVDPPDLQIMARMFDDLVRKGIKEISKEISTFKPVTKRRRKKKEEYDFFDFF